MLFAPPVADSRPLPPVAPEDRAVFRPFPSTRDFVERTGAREPRAVSESVGIGAGVGEIRGEEFFDPGGDCEAARSDFFFEGGVERRTTGDADLDRRFDGTTREIWVVRAAEDRSMGTRTACSC